MSDADNNVTAFEKPRQLADAIRSVKNANADRDDVVIEMREAERMRLELLAQELAPVIAEVPQDTDLFDFAVSTGLQPRFWIDAVSHVSMGRDKRTFRFLKDTRNGRVVLAETTDIKTVANQVTRYLAERIVERQRLMEGDLVDYRTARTASISDDRPEADGHGMPPASSVSAAAPLERPASGGLSSIVAMSETPDKPRWRRFMIGTVLVAAGIVAGLGSAAALYWDRLELDKLWTQIGG